MKPQQVKDNFMAMRAQGKSYSLKAYEQTELQGKIEALETIVEGRT